MNLSILNQISTGKSNAKLFAAIGLLYLFIFSFSPESKSQVNNNLQSNFYAITGNGIKDTSWLFGTYHLVRSSYLNEVPAVNEAFRNASGVVVEMVMDTAKAPAAMAMGMLQKGTLSDLLQQTFADSLDNELKTTLGAGIAQLNQFKPMNVMLTLSIIYLMQGNNIRLQQFTGPFLDGYFAEEGKFANKSITPLENIEDQMNLLFNTTSNEEQVKQLQYFLRNKTEMIDQGNALLGNWFEHDLDKMHALSQKSLHLFGSSELFLKNRNDKWMKSIPELMAKESQFIAVGALHLTGPEGLIFQLKQMGYTITPIKL